MKNNIRQVVANNLISLRKQKGLTQNELAKKLAYSDNMVSRWERAEISPSIETLEKISEFYEVPIEYLFKEHALKDPKYERDVSLKNFSALLMLVATLWFGILVVYIYASIILDKDLWRLFILGLPLSCLILMPFKGKWGTPVYRFVLETIFTWTLLTYLYLYFIEYNAFLIFIIGIPTQLSLVIKTFIKPKTSTKK